MFTNTCQCLFTLRAWIGYVGKYFSYVQVYLFICSGLPFYNHFPSPSVTQSISLLNELFQKCMRGTRITTRSHDLSTSDILQLFFHMEILTKSKIATSNMIHVINSLHSSDAIWWHKSGSTLVQAMACCLMAPSHYLNQCWLSWVRSSDNYLWAISPDIT